MNKSKCKKTENEISGNSRFQSKNEGEGKIKISESSHSDFIKFREMYESISLKNAFFFHS